MARGRGSCGVNGESWGRVCNHIVASVTARGGCAVTVAILAESNDVLPQRGVRGLAGQNSGWWG